MAQSKFSDDKPAVCPIPHGPRGAMAPESELNPLNNMPHLSQDRAPHQKMALSRERVVSSIPRASTSAAPGDSPYASSCPVDHSAMGKDKDKEDANGYWEYPSPQQFYNALVRKGWETPEESVDMVVMIHNFLNERAWQEIIEWEKMAGSDVSKLQLARFQGRPGTLSPRARMFGWLAWAFPDRFSNEPPFDRHDWIVRRGPTEANPEGEEVRYVIDYYSREDESDENEASFNLDVRPAISDLSSAKLRWKKLMQEYESGELFAPFRDQSSSSDAK
ncbi:cyc3-holocytochrome-c synthase (cytochrome c heme lyase) [Malassezia pachydermatis]|uniref:Holocytochrome c-type synthase n=1 Tax=Malassezia pachydermatis TaxID=77020 RepID=A0A0M8MRB5_9BASI|nr:cyc3-holocytochrome-c synthase (cytochrome c heme lyase) [Malassezia pachydermatis]KOS12764.1 cyc3-holocytochrome-c synthase (cytochrome c heme lyase) [Malassezia pachydermatis]